MRNGYSKTLTVILILIIIAVIALLTYLGYDYYSRYRTNKDGESYVDSFANGITVDAPIGDTSTSIETPTDITTNTAEENILTDITTDNNSSSASSTKKRPTYKGFYVLGTIEIPKTGIKYPVLDRVTKRSLETSVAVVWPEDAELNTPGNVVISGHNYRNGMFFSNNKKLSKGDKIYITDLNKKRIAYTIYNIFETSDSDTKFYTRNTDGKREITLSTCTDDSLSRLIVEARE